MSLSLYPKSIEHNFAFIYATVHPSLYRNLGQPYGTYISTLYHYIHKEESFVLLLHHHLKDFPANPHFLPDTKGERHIRVSTECRQKRRGFLFGCYFRGDIILFYLFIYDRITLGFSSESVYIMFFCWKIWAFGFYLLSFMTIIKSVSFSIMSRIREIELLSVSK